MFSLLPEYLQKENNRKLCTLFLDRWGSLITVSEDITTVRSIDKAEGVNLDHLGETLGQSRTTLDDVEYRALIITSMMSHLSKGELHILRTVARSLFTDTFEGVEERWPAGVKIALSREADPRVLGSMQRVKAGGVELIASTRTEDSINMNLSSATVDRIKITVYPKKGE